MDYRSGKPVIRALGVFAAIALSLFVGGCGKTPAPEESAKGAGQSAPDAAAAIKNQAKEPARVDAAGSHNSALAAAVKDALAADARLKTFAIDVRATDGAVELFGTVDAKRNREKAEKIAAAVKGVKSVKNHIVLVSGS